MADQFCPNCGMPNPEEQTVCSFCLQPLNPEAGAPSIRPGEMPTKKTTAELEPILPAWLRAARETARRTDAETAAEEAQAAAEKSAPKEEVPDFLAGLASAGREEQDDEIPEWMRGAAPASAPAAKPDETEQTFPRRQELRWGDEPSDELGGMATTPIPSAPESGDAMLPWLQDADRESDGEQKEVSDWLARQEPGQPVNPFSSDTVEPPHTGELTDWLDKAAVESAAPAEPSAPAADDSLDDWLSKLPRDVEIPAPAESAEPFDAAIDLPDWMKSASQEEKAAPAESAEPFDATIDLPDWMKPAPQEETDSADAELPDWMSSFREQKPFAPPPLPPAEPAEAQPPAPAFVPEAEPALAGQPDNLFSIEMPDWLSNIAPAEATERPAQENLADEPIAPAELPSWVQAMRPVETVLPGAPSTSPVVEGPLEEAGPLAGLRGVLPFVGGLIQPGKPRGQSLRLEASQAQQSDASLLGQLLAAETQPKPLRSAGIFRSQRLLRWVLSVVLILLVAIILFSGTQIVPLPAALPPESALALPILESLPANAPVLMVFDYDPALAGELEAAAAPFVDRLLGLRSPRLTVLSTSPLGPALAEHFLTALEARQNYRAGQNYANFGYLPGGETGILSFAVNPRFSLPSSHWTSPAAQDVTRFADYAALVLLTDQAENARAWVEQTTPHREGHPLIAIASAQAAPMIQPYLLSGQVNALVSGLHDGAAFEASSGVGSPVRAYWDAYNLALSLAVLLMVFGGLWNLIAGLRASPRGLDEA